MGIVPSASTLTLTADNQVHGNGIKYSPVVHNPGIDVMSSDYKSMDQYTPMAVQPQQGA